MKTTVKEIFNYISSLNANTSHISSLGSYVSATDQQIAASTHNEVIDVLPVGTLAHKIVSSMTNYSNYSAKQLWVIAFELEKNAEFSAKVAEFNAEVSRKESMRKAAKRAKKERRAAMMA
jgi:hypothetical protein